MNKYKILIADLYLVWVNDFISLNNFCLYYDFTLSEGEQLIEIGRDFQNQRAEEFKRSNDKRKNKND